MRMFTHFARCRWRFPRKRRVCLHKLLSCVHLWGELLSRLAQVVHRDGCCSVLRQKIPPRASFSRRHTRFCLLPTFSPFVQQPERRPPQAQELQHALSASCLIVRPLFHPESARRARAEGPRGDQQHGGDPCESSFQVGQVMVPNTHLVKMYNKTPHLTHSCARTTHLVRHGAWLQTVQTVSV